MNFFNPYLPQNNPYTPTPYQTQVVRVKGRNGADAFAMGPNCSALLLDEGGTMVWLCVTDGAGYKTISPYDITPHQDAPAPDFGSLESRISRLEAMVSEYTANTAAAKPGAAAEPVRDQANDGNGAQRWQSSGHAAGNGPK